MEGENARKSENEVIKMFEHEKKKNIFKILDFCGCQFACLILK